MQRVIYSLELEPDAGPGPQSTVLICPLDREGNTLHTYVLGIPRMIDVRPRDTVQHAKGQVEGDRREGMAGDVHSRQSASAAGRLSRESAILTEEARGTERRKNRWEAAEDEG